VDCCRWANSVRFLPFEQLYFGHTVTYNTPMNEPSQTPLPDPTPVMLKPPSPENLWGELAVAMSYLTRFNLRLKEDPKPHIFCKSMTWFPLVGVLVGVLGAGVDWIFSRIGMQALICATFTVVAMLWATRALHEEEFASLVNSYGRSVGQDEKVGWLREERSVRYGTLGVVLIIIMKIGAISSFGDGDETFIFQILIASGAWSRAMMVAAAWWLRPLQGDPVADNFQHPPVLRVMVALGIGAVLVYCTMDDYTTMVLSTGTFAGLIVALIGQNHLRGYNGALLGTLQEIVELAMFGGVLAVQ